MSRSCGPCSLCCKVMGVEELAKPRDVWCTHARPGAAAGCSIHCGTDYPPSCGDFTCAWAERDTLPESLRPDRVHAFFAGLKDGTGVALHVDATYPDAWRKEPLASYVRRLTNGGVKVVVACGKKRFMRLGKEWVAVTMDK